MPQTASLLISAMGGSMLLPLLNKQDAERLFGVLLPPGPDAENEEGMDDAGNVV